MAVGSDDLPRKGDTPKVASPAGKVVAIFGLGNPGAQYVDTRHNIGFMVIDLLVRRHSFSVEKSNKNIELYRGRIFDYDVYLGKPLTYMNLSGQAARPVLQLRKIPRESMLVVTDDFSLPLGRQRLRADGSAGGHNGLKSLIAELGSQVFPRLKVGIGPVPERWDPADFVLGKFSSAEAEPLSAALVRSADCVELWLKEGIQAAMNLYNRG